MTSEVAVAVAVVRRAVDQKPAAALTLRHVDRIGELMEADDDDDDMTSDSCRRSLDKHDQDDDEVVVGGPGAGAELPPADDGASCVNRPHGGIGCHGDGDESDRQQRQTEESEPSQQPEQQHSPTAGHSPSH